MICGDPRCTGTHNNSLGLAAGLCPAAAERKNEINARRRRERRVSDPEFLTRERTRDRGRYHGSPSRRAQMRNAGDKYLLTAKGMLSRVRANARERGNR